MRQVADDLGVGFSTLNKWKSRLEEAELMAGPHDDVMKELARLRRENELLRAERDLLKKATADSNGRRNMASIGCHLRRINDVAHGATGPISGTEARALDDRRIRRRWSD